MVPKLWQGNRPDLGEDKGSRAHLGSGRKEGGCHFPVSSVPLLGAGRNPGSRLSWSGERGTVRDELPSFPSVYGDPCIFSIFAHW